MFVTQNLIHLNAPRPLEAPAQWFLGQLHAVTLCVCGEGWGVRGAFATHRVMGTLNWSAINQVMICLGCHHLVRVLTPHVTTGHWCKDLKTWTTNYPPTPPLNQLNTVETTQTLLSEQRALRLNSNWLEMWFHPWQTLWIDREREKAKRFIMKEPCGSALYLLAPGRKHKVQCFWYPCSVPLEKTAWTLEAPAEAVARFLTLAAVVSALCDSIKPPEERETHHTVQVQ